jgi:hypothetical protein
VTNEPCPVAVQSLLDVAFAHDILVADRSWIADISAP